MSGTNVQSRRFCFTVNNYDIRELTWLERLSDSGRREREGVKYVVFGREVGTAGTPHLQGYIEFSRPVRARKVKEHFLGVRAHVEKANGTGKQASDYCKKEGEWIEYGVLSQGQGSRSDLSTVEEAVASGTSIVDVSRDHFIQFVKYSRGIERAINLRATPRSWRTQVVWTFGDTGTGKTYSSFKEAEALSNGFVSWVSDSTLKWFDGFVPNSKCCIFDDFDGKAELAMLLRVFDRYPLKVPIKGSFIEFNPRICYVTSNFSPFALYGGHAQFKALMRRIDEVSFKGDNESWVKTGLEYFSDYFD